MTYVEIINMSYLKSLNLHNEFEDKSWASHINIKYGSKISTQ